MPSIAIDLPVYIFIFGILILVPFIASGVCATEDCVTSYIIALLILVGLLCIIILILLVVFGWELETIAPPWKHVIDNIVIGDQK
jgi:hypothetical protein